MQKISREIAEFFLENQGRLFNKAVADTVEESIEFLEDCMANVFESITELKEYWKEEGADINEMSDEEILDSLEVFVLPDGKILLVEA